MLFYDVTKIHIFLKVCESSCENIMTLFVSGRISDMSDMKMSFCNSYGGLFVCLTKKIVYSLVSEPYFSVLVCTH